jgi:ferredoxin
MTKGTLRIICFSPTGGTEKVLRAAAAGLPFKPVFHDLCVAAPGHAIRLGLEDTALIGMPVFAGRLPPFAAEALSRFHGNNRPTVLMVVYGNREYEDALIELRDLAESRGFVPVAGGAFIAEHSIVRSIASRRPDAKDRTKARSFGEAAARKIAEPSAEAGVRLEVKGSRPYRDLPPGLLNPYAGKSCNACGVCAAACPVGAIPEAEPQRTDSAKCICCCRCIRVCPQKARRFKRPMLAAIKARILPLCAARKEPEIFL